MESYAKLEAVLIGVVLGTWAEGFLRSPMWTALVWICNGLFPLPANAGLRVFQDDACFQKLLTNLIGLREVFGFLGGRARLHQRLDLRVENRVGLHGWRQHIEYRIELAQELQRRSHVAGAKLARVHGAI